MKQHHFFRWLLALVVVVAAGLFAVNVNRTRAAKQYINSTTPTFFVHGWGSSYHAEQHMTNAAKRAGVTNTVIWANVAKNNQVTFHGNIKKGARNPIIEVNLADNKQMSYKRDGRYVYDVINAATQKWHFKRMNLVGHSMGNLDIAYYLLDYGQRSDLPKLNKQVAMAAHFNGGIGFGYPKGATDNAAGKPSKEESHFSELEKLRTTYPKGAKVLNIYGDVKDGTHSDTQVPVESAKTMKYLVSPRAGSYQEKEFTGKNAQHSALHRNAKVDKVLIDFLWGK